MVKQSTQFALAGIVLVGVFVAAFVAKEYFLPEDITKEDEDPPEGNVTAVKRGAWTGKENHRASGEISILNVSGAFYLRFEKFDMTPGPDVFLYLTPSADPDTEEEVLAGLKVLIDGGADGGEVTKSGDFNQRLPADFDPSKYSGAAVWCDQFGVPFGAAPLLPTFPTPR